MNVLFTCLTSFGFGLSKAINAYQKYLEDEVRLRPNGVIDQLPTYYNTDEKNKELALELITAFFSGKDYHYSMVEHRNPDIFEVRYSTKSRHRRRNGRNERNRL